MHDVLEIWHTAVTSDSHQTERQNTKFVQKPTHPQPSPKQQANTRAEKNQTKCTARKKIHSALCLLGLPTGRLACVVASEPVRV